MFSPEEHQIGICLLKSNLEEIENDLIHHRATLPELEAENEQKYRETAKALKIVRSLNTEIEKLKHENMCLTVKRMHLKLQCDEVAKALESSQSNRALTEQSLKQEKNVIEYKIREYENSLKEKAERYRSTHWYYNEDVVSAETNKVNHSIADLGVELDKKQNFVNELKKKADSIQPDIPENILEIIGKIDLDNKMKELTEKYEVLDEKRKRLLL